jgi:hypothetical protein
LLFSEEIFAAIPRTLDAALQPSAQARVVTEARPPFRITHVNAAWEGLCGFTRAEAVGQVQRHFCTTLSSSSASSLVMRVCCVLCVGLQTLSLLQGPLTEPGLLQHVEQQTAAHQATAVMLTNYTKVGLGAIYRHYSIGSHHLFYGCTAGQAHVPESLAGGAVVRQPRPGPTPSSPFLLPGVFCF